jgi:hypothetical protein
MPLYFFVLKQKWFFDRVRPALSTSWKKRDFGPCRTLCADLLPTVDSFAQRYHIDPTQTLIHHVTQGLGFERDSWRCLVGEVLLFGAEEVPEFETAPETLCCLLSPESYGEDTLPRERFSPIQQAHFGSRDLLFGGAYYRPEHAGWNDGADVVRLAAYLEAVDPGRWRVEDLRPLTQLKTDEDRADELAYAREWFPALQELYRRAMKKSEILACETLCL